MPIHDLSEFSPPQAAARLAEIKAKVYRSESYIRNLCRAGVLGRWVDSQYVISAEQLARYADGLIDVTQVANSATRKDAANATEFGPKRAGVILAKMTKRKRPYSEIAIKQFCQEGRLGRKVGNRYKITEAELREFAKLDRKPGRPRPSGSATTPAPSAARSA